MTKLETITRALDGLNTPGRTFTVKIENGLYCIYANNELILYGRESIIYDLIHGFIMGFCIGWDSHTRNCKI